MDIYRYEEDPIVRNSNGVDIFSVLEGQGHRAMVDEIKYRNTIADAREKRVAIRREQDIRIGIDRATYLREAIA